MRPTKFPTPVRPRRLKECLRKTIHGSAPSLRQDTSSTYALDIKTFIPRITLSQPLSPMLEEQHEYLVSHQLQPMGTLPRTVPKALQILHHPANMDAGNLQLPKLLTTPIHNGCKKSHLTILTTHPTATPPFPPDHQPQPPTFPLQFHFKRVQSRTAPP